MGIDLSSIRPFEICSIRPPTENLSLTFRLTRNCYWNKCKFCPVYKFGAHFSKRSVEEVKEDVRRAKRIDSLLIEEGIDYSGYRSSTPADIFELIKKIKEAGGELGETEEIQKDLDPRLVWFLSWFKNKPNIKDNFNHILSWRAGGGQTCFMGDADFLILKPDYLAEAIDEIRINFPTIRRFTVYGRTKTAASVRTLKELKEYRKAGLDRVHFGLESGSNAVLKFVNKGVTGDEHVEGGIKVKEAGLSCSVYVMPGLGGVKWTKEHAYDTADVLTKISPDFIRLRTLQVFPQTSLEKALKNGDFMEASEEQVVEEIRTMIEEIDTKTNLISDSATNLIDVNGKLPDNREAMLEKIDQYLTLSAREKLLFSLESRINSFAGQYGGLTRDIYQKITPFIKDGRIDCSDAPDAEITDIINLIRSKLMP